jgi:aspartokinase-like uncharacterized kinase
MAILAMQQYGLLLQAREPRLVLLETEAEMLACRPAPAGLAALALAGLEPGIEASWNVTSDSLGVVARPPARVAAAAAGQVGGLARRAGVGRNAGGRGRPGRGIPGACR